MRKRYGLLGLVMTLIGLTACGGGGGTSAINRLVGTWELRERSTNGGETWSQVTNGFRFILNNDGTWTDTDGDGGTWELRGALLVVRHNSLQATEYFLFTLETGNTRLRLTVSDAVGTPTNRLSRYQKVEIIRSE